MRKHGGTPSWRNKHVTLAAISPPSVVRGGFVGGHQSGLAGCKPPPLFKRGASSCSSKRQRQRDPCSASPRPSAPTYLPSTTPRGGNYNNGPSPSTKSGSPSTVSGNTEPRATTASLRRHTTTSPQTSSASSPTSSRGRPPCHQTGQTLSAPSTKTGTGPTRASGAPYSVQSRRSRSSGPSSCAASAPTWTPTYPPASGGPSRAGPHTKPSSSRTPSPTWTQWTSS